MRSRACQRRRKERLAQPSTSFPTFFFHHHNNHINNKMEIRESHDDALEFTGYDEDSELQFREHHGDADGIIVSPDVPFGMNETPHLLDLCLLCALPERSLTPVRPSFITNLNQDVRRMIYRLHLKSETPTLKPAWEAILLATANTRKRKKYKPTKWCTIKSGIWSDICRTCRFIASESLPILYGENIFEFLMNPNEDAAAFCALIGSNRLLINKAIFAVIRHNHTSAYDCDDFDEYDESDADDPLDSEVYLCKTNISDVDNLPCLKQLSIIYTEETKESGAASCPYFESLLAANDSSFVVQLLQSDLHSLHTLKIEGVPTKTVDDILKFLQSGEKYVAPPQKPETIPITRSLPLHACISCQNCKCAHGVKPEQLLQVQEALKLVQTQISGGATKLDERITKLLERFAKSFL